MRKKEKERVLRAQSVLLQMLAALLEEARGKSSQRRARLRARLSRQSLRAQELAAQWDNQMLLT